MKTKHSMAILSLLCLGVTVWPATSRAAAPTASEAKVSREAATTTALAEVPGGTVKDGELEREHGRLVWSFDIAMQHTANVREVQVDAISGRIVSVETETPAQQRKEAEEDSKVRRP